MIDYKATIEKFKSQFGKFEKVAKEYEKQLFEEDLKYYDDPEPFTSKNSIIVIYHITLKTKDDVEYFFACKSNSEPISKKHIALFVNGRTIHYNTNQILSATEIIAHSPEQLPERVHYSVIDDCYVKIHHSSKHSSVDIINKLNTIIREVVKMTDEEWQFIHQITEYQVKEDFGIYTETILQALEKYPKEHLTANDIREAVENFRATIFEQNEN